MSALVLPSRVKTSGQCIQDAWEATNLHLPSCAHALYRISARQAVIVCAGVWSGKLLTQVLGTPVWSQLLQPRRGHLLELQPPKGMPVLQHGVMELSYTQHYVTNQEVANLPATKPVTRDPDHPSSQAADITFTATTSASGTLLIGQ